MFLRNIWYCAAESKELGSEPLGRVFLNEPVALYRKADGAPVAFEDRCCHRRAPLSKGKVEGDALRCGYHGFLYDATGACIWTPGQTNVPPNASVRTYPLCERHGYIWIWMGAPARADVPPAAATPFPTLLRGGRRRLGSPVRASHTFCRPPGAWTTVTAPTHVLPALTSARCVLTRARRPHDGPQEVAHGALRPAAR